MICPSCGEDTSLKDIWKSWLWGKVPWSFLMWVKRRKEAAELRELKRLWLPLINSEKITDREFSICMERLKGKSFEEIAKEMNVTRERIRMIQAKVLRKLRRMNEIY